MGIPASLIGGEMVLRAVAADPARALNSRGNYGWRNSGGTGAGITREGRIPWRAWWARVVAARGSPAVPILASRSGRPSLQGRLKLLWLFFASWLCISRISASSVRAC